MPQRGTNVLQHGAKNKMVSTQSAIYISSFSSPLYKFFYYKVRLFLAHIAHISYLRASVLIQHEHEDELGTQLLS